MQDREFRPLPDEFNFGYLPPVKEEEEEKKRKRKRIRRIAVLAAAVFIILPLTLRTGLFAENANGSAPADIPASDSGQGQSSSQDEHSSSPKPYERPTVFSRYEGTYAYGNTYVHLEKGSGWFFNGRYYIPLTYDPDRLTYRAAGAYPEAEAMALESTVNYVSAEGKIEIIDQDIRMYDPFTQTAEVFSPSEALFDTSFISAALSDSSLSRAVYGNWTGTFVPDASIPMAYITDMILSADGGLQIRVSDNMTDNTEVFEGTWTMEDGILKTAFSLPLKYEIAASGRTVSCEFGQNPEGVFFCTEDGYYLFLNIFSSQLFVH